MLIMPWENITQIVLAVITIIASPIASKIINNQKEDRQKAAYEMLVKLLDNEKHHKLIITQYFRMATGLKMQYDDIIKIINDNNSIWLIDFLRQMPGFVSYENGVFQYNKRFQNNWYLPWVKKVSNLFNVFGKSLSIAGYLLFSSVFFYLNMIEKISVVWNIVFIILIFFSAYGFVIFRNFQDDNEKLDEFIGIYKSKKL